MSMSALGGRAGRTKVRVRGVGFSCGCGGVGRGAERAIRRMRIHRFGGSSGLGGMLCSMEKPIMRRTTHVRGTKARILGLGVKGPTPFKFEAPSRIVCSVERRLARYRKCSPTGNLFSTEGTVVRCTRLGGLPGMAVRSVCAKGNIDRLVGLYVSTLLSGKSRVLVPSPSCPL